VTSAVMASLLRRSPALWAQRSRYVKVKHPDGRVLWQPWRFGGYEFLREPHDCMAPRTIVMKCSQVGATELLVNRELHMLHAWGLDTIHLLPAADEATDFSDGRFKEVTENSPALDGLFIKVDNKGHKVTGTGANAYFRGGNSRSKVKSSPASFLAIDEHEEISAETIELARDRLAGQHPDMRWEVNVSTPVHPNLGIHKEFQRTDQRRFHVQCPECHGWGPFDFWLGKGEEREPSLREVDGRMVTRCTVSGCVFPEAAMPAAKAAGVWVPDRPDAGVRGYHILGLLSPTKPWRMMLAEYHRSTDDPDPRVMREWVNGTVGEPFVEKGMAVDREVLQRHAQAKGITAGAPVQPRMSAGVDAGVRGHYLAIMGHGEAPGAPRQVHRAVRCASYDEVAALLMRYQVTSVVVDAQPNTEMARVMQSRLADKGIACSLCFYTVNGKFRAKWEATAPDGAHVVAHRTELLNEVMLGGLVGGDIVLPQDVDPEVLDHCANMRKVVEPDTTGNLRASWVEDGPDHYAHAIAYAALAMEQVGVGAADDWTQEHGLEESDFGDDDDWWRD